jgi:protein-disulfide isomerase
MSRSLARLSVVFGAAAGIVVLAILTSSGGGDDGFRDVARAPVRDVTSIVAGIPQDGLVLGAPTAPILLVEFADPQCPYCREFAVQTWPVIVKKFIRTGKVRMELRLVDFVGKDSRRANRALVAAAMQDKLWDASARFYDVQGRENSGYVTDAFLRSVLGGVKGLDVARAMADRGSPVVRHELGAVKTMGSRYGVEATPTLLIGTDDTDLTLVADGVIAPDRLAQAINERLLKTI